MTRSAVLLAAVSLVCVCLLSGCDLLSGRNPKVLYSAKETTTVALVTRRAAGAEGLGDSEPIRLVIPRGALLRDGGVCGKYRFLRAMLVIPSDSVQMWFGKVRTADCGPATYEIAQ